MKVLARIEGLAVAVTVETADLPKETLMKWTGDLTVDKAGSNERADAGCLTVPSKDANGNGTVETPYKTKVEIEADGALAVGDDVKLGALNGTTQTAKAFVDGTDSEELRWGVCVKAAADEGTATVLTY